MENIGLKISEVIQPNAVDLTLKNVHNKDEAIQYLAGLLDDAGLLVSKSEYIQSVYDRESLGPTYMEHFIAIPHGKSPAVREAGIAFGRSTEGFFYETALGGGIARLVFLLAIPDRMSADAYMGVLARLARLLVHEEFREALMSASCYQDVVMAITNSEDLLES
ncbi:MAG: PTS sugar transporter subunit IIA [Chloroflexi bacterium]|jgi:PTS system fructose-specific IIA component|nr:PTS sugar transporter subunit IIA [Anaerolineaceae bacterium]NMB87650.1 PTS sugar transporter subunit IIA [Chloroflexota bacterium]